jgi:S1-C subfamily serine protease
LDLPGPGGALVVAVGPGGAADRGLLHPGDVIVAIESAPVNGIDDLHRHLTEERVGVLTRLRIVRDGEVLTLDVVPTDGGPP